MWMRPGANATAASRNTPCQKSANRVRAPLSMFDLLRTISEIIGRPPIDAAATFATPTARRSRFMSVFRCHGSRRSIAFAESNDSTLPTRANIATHQRPEICVSGRVKTEKSGVVNAASRLPGTLTRNDSPTAYSWPANV